MRIEPEDYCNYLCVTESVYLKLFSRVTPLIQKNNMTCTYIIIKSWEAFRRAPHTLRSTLNCGADKKDKFLLLLRLPEQVEILAQFYSIHTPIYLPKLPVHANLSGIPQRMWPHLYSNSLLYSYIILHVFERGA